MMIIQSVLLVATLFCVVSIFYHTVVCGISPVPTSGQAKRVVLDLLNRYRNGHRVYELGSGWGTLTSSISEAFPEYRVTGYERSPVPFLYSAVVNRISRRKNCRLKYRDFFRASYADADVVVCYLCPDIMRRLAPKLEDELRGGSMVISSTFAVPGWQPVDTITLNDLYQSKVYVYRKNENNASHSNLELQP